MVPESLNDVQKHGEIQHHASTPSTGCRALGPKSLDAGREQRLGVGPKFCACSGSAWIHSTKNLTKTLVFRHPSVLMSNEENVVITGDKPSSEIDVDKIYFMDA